MSENNIVLEGFGYFQDFWSANQASGPILFIAMLVAKFPLSTKLHVEFF